VTGRIGVHVERLDPVFEPVVEQAGTERKGPFVLPDQGLDVGNAQVQM
jgi:hypothetical protein